MFLKLLIGWPASMSTWLRRWPVVLLAATLAPIADAREKHAVVAQEADRVANANTRLPLFADAVCLDEGFPMGPLRQGNTAPCLIGAEAVAGSVKSGWKGRMDTAALWNRALSDQEIECLSGGAAAHPGELGSKRSR